MISYVKDKWYIPKWAIEEFLKCCPYCAFKRNNENKGVIVRPIRSERFGERCQVDLIDFQYRQDRGYSYILNYQDHLTKFCMLRPLRTKRASEVVEELFQIFALWGAPRFLQSDNGREFVNKLLVTMLENWPGCSQIHGHPRYPQSQGSVERCNGTVEEMIGAVLSKWQNNNWTKAMFYVMFAKNTQVHETIGRSPYVALLGYPPPVPFHLRDNPDGEEGECGRD